MDTNRHRTPFSVRSYDDIILLNSELLSFSSVSHFGLNRLLFKLIGFAV